MAIALNATDSEEKDKKILERHQTHLHSSPSHSSFLTSLVLLSLLFPAPPSSSLLLPPLTLCSLASSPSPFPSSTCLSCRIDSNPLAARVPTWVSEVIYEGEMS
eukprot:766795-Hanusia_phi.AAC.1